MLEDDVNTNKQFRAYEESGKHLRLSVDEAIARNLNAWQGWTCSAGVRGMYIDFDGNLWICNTASSKIDRFNYTEWEASLVDITPEVKTQEWWDKLKVIGLNYRKTKNAFKMVLPNDDVTRKQYPGFIGNIYNGYELPKAWVTCPWQSCGCGADVILSKAKTTEHKELLSVTKGSWSGKEKTLKNAVDTISESVAVEMNFPIPYQILWDLGRRCNYDCSYCWTSVHNRTDDHKDFDLLVQTTNRIIDDWAHGDTIRWNFGGGEPTLHPRFLDFLKHLNNRNQWIMVTTNGTRDHKYWAEAVKYINSINLSAHFDGLLSDKEEDRFVRNIDVICEHFEQHNDDHWLEIKIMTPPEYINRALKLRDKIKALGRLDKLGANNRINGFLSLVPIRSIGDSGALVEYTEEQLEIFRHQ